jgi:putative transposase
MSSTYLNLNVHIIFATKGRAPTIADDWRQDLHAYIGGTLKTLGARPQIVGGVADHVHLLVGLKSTHSVADLAREVKKVSSVWAADRYAAFSWQAGYAAFSIGAERISNVTTYIANQERHHRKLSSADELRQLLAEEGIEYDERFFA